MIGAYAVGSHQGYVYVRNEYPLAVLNTREAIEQAREPGPLGRRHPGQRFQLRRQGGPRRRGLHLRRVHRADGFSRGRGRRAQAQGRPHGRTRLSRPAHRPQQRGDLGQRPPYHPERGGLVRGQGHRPEQGHQDLRPHRPREEHGTGRGGDGHDAPADHLRHRRRRAERQSRSRRCRPADRRVAVCRSLSSTCPWTTRPWPRPAP